MPSAPQYEMPVSEPQPSYRSTVETTIRGKTYDFEVKVFCVESAEPENGKNYPLRSIIKDVIEGYNGLDEWSPMFMINDLVNVFNGIARVEIKNKDEDGLYTEGFVYVAPGFLP